MKKLLLLACALFFIGHTFGQLSGVKTIPGTYATIALAIADLNTQGVGAGGVTFNVAAGYTETFAILTAGLITATGTSANPIVFQKSGAGVNPIITAATPGTGTYDYIICLGGTDYITFDGINLQENAANTTTAQQMEWGYAILKGSATNGSQSVTIKNCNVSLNKANTATYGIYSQNYAYTAMGTNLTVTSVAGANSNNKIFSNAISNTYGGIYMWGFADANYPFTFYDQNNEIGVGGANALTNIGGGSSIIYGIYSAYQNGLKIANNTFTGTITGTSTFYPIYTSTGNNANVDIYGNSLTFTFTGTTSTIYGIYSGMGALGINNTVNVYNNTVTINYSTATTGTIYSIYHAATAFNFNCYGNNVINNILGSVATTGTGTWAGIYTFGGNTNLGSQWQIYNNNVNGNSRVQSVFATGTCYGIYNSASGLTLNVYNNNVNNNSWPGSSAAYPIYLSTSAITMSVNGNIIHDNSKPNAVVNVLPRSSSLYGLFVSNSGVGNTTQIYNNNIYNLSNTWGGQVNALYCGFGASGTGNVYSNNVYNLTANDQAIFGIYNVTGLTNNIYKNNLYNFSATVGDSASFYGVCMGSSTAYSVSNAYNNFISDLKAQQAVNYLCAGLYAFSATTTAKVNFYYNTVYLNQTPTAGGPATAAVYANTAPLLEMRNNILYNNSGVFGTGLTIAYWRSSATPATYSPNSSSNLFYAGPLSASNLIFFDFTNSDQTIAAYKARFPQEAQSFTETPPFVNVAATPYNLHLQTTIATQCESGGQPITSPAITMDYDDQLRSTTTPDIGADEFAGIPNDQSPPVINYTPLSNGPIGVTRAFTNVSIFDPSGVNTTSGLRPRCYYKKSTNANTFADNTSATDGWKWVEATGTTSPFTFNINYALLSGGSVVAGDIIQYFVDAQDAAATVHVGLKLGILATQPATVNLTAANFPATGSIFQYNIVSGIGGVVTVGTAGTYPNLTGAAGLFAAINAGVVTSNITANIISDLTEDGANALNQYIEDPPNSNFTLTIQPSAATMRTISGSFAGGLIRLNGADRVTFNGNFSGTGSYLTFSNTVASGTTSVFLISSLGPTLGATNNTIKNCNIMNGYITSGAYCISVGGATVGSSGDDNDNLTIQNNILSKSYYGMYLVTSAAGVNDNLIISNNTIGSALATDYITYYGIYISGANAPLVSGNEIFNLISSVNTTYAAIELSSYVTNALVQQNKIHDLQNNNTGGWGMFGIDIGSATFSYGNQIINNLIYNLTTTNYSASSTTYNPFGIRIAGGSGHKVYHNTVRMTGTQQGTNTAGTLSAAFIVTATTATLLDVRDNIFTNNIVGLAGSKSYAIYVPAGTPLTSFNYNDYFASGTYGVLGFLGVDMTTLAAWQAASGQDANSVSADPVYVSSTDLHPTSALVAKVGTYLAAVPTDYSGAFRTNPPDLGAYQFSANPVVTTTAATAIGPNYANLNGTINANSATVTSGFEYGLTTAYGTTVAGIPLTVTGTLLTGISAFISGLTPGTLYHFRAKGTSGAVIVNGTDMTFTTTSTPPTVVTTAATAVTSTTATLNGTVNANGSSTTVSFDYGLTIAYGTNVPGVPVTVTGNTVTACLANIAGLLPGNTYHFRINGTSSGGTANGNNMTFVTPPAAPTIVTLAATGLVGANATLNGTANANGALTTLTFDYGLTIAYGQTAAGVPPTVTGNTTTPVLANITGLLLNQTYHFRLRGTNSVGTTNGLDMTFFTGCNPAGPAGPITGPSQVCQGGSGYVYTVAPIVNATGYNWTLPTGGTITSGANTNSITVSYSAVAVSGYVSVYGTSTCGNGAASQLPVNVNSPSVPTITGPSPVCVNSTGNVYTTETGMTNYIWVVVGGTVTAGGGTTNNSVTVTWTTTGTQTVSVGYTNGAGCATITPTVKNITVNPRPTPTITGPATACTMFPGLIYSTEAGNTGYSWTISAGGTITGGTGTSSITVTWNTAGAQSVSVNYNNASGCPALTPTVYPVTVNTGVTPTITGPTPVCINSSGVNYNTESGFTNYVWTISAGGAITAGQGTNVIQVTWNTSGAQWVAVNYTSAAGCSAPAPVQYAVTVNPLPGSAGAITGTAAVCAGATGIAYSIATVPNTTTYVWSLPAGATIASGAGTNAITVDFAANAASGDITVTPNNVCGNGSTSPPFAVTITPMPDPAGAITGTAAVCQGTSGVVYSIAAIANATGYVWTVPAGATIVNGNNTISITVDFAMNAVSGIITVYGTNSCGNGTVSPDFNVTVNPIPSTPVVTSNGDTLYSSAPAGNQWYFEGAPIMGATGQTYIATVSGYYWVVVTLNGCSSDESNHVNMTIIGLEPLQAGSYSVYPVPNDGRFTVSITNPTLENFTIKVYNNLGVMISEIRNVEVNGTAERTVDLRPTPSGIYSVVIENDSKRVVRKILINR